MTETVSTRAKARGKGLKLERVFSTEGTHPYDAITWERRDVVQQNWKTGETVFEQRGVEFPDFWSVNASTIVTTKYFRGAVGTDVREWSLKQLIDRVVKTYTKAGIDNGYFAGDADAEIFEHELTWLLVNQYFSFNSPVWFNVGTPSPQQVSACFILSVDDSMDSILNWYKEEGFIFKGGSGAGLNLSRIRSSKELLSSGGTASRSRLLHARRRRVRGHHQVGRRHASCGQDGRPRRRPPRHRGVRDDQGARGGQDPRPARRRLRHGPRRRRHHLRAVPERQQLGPRQRRVHACGRGRHRVRPALRAAPARSSRPSTPATCSARSATAAWECADPGLQYDDTINDWHTNPETGRITASNPCSEYMSLDNSSCNLASLNLLKFLKDDDTFDAALFAKAVEFIITAMDISICFADFPTEAIGKTTVDYRQLGIGYANLGALLMAMGLGYDSEGGRSMAAAHHVAHDRYVVQALAPSSPGSSARTPATPATPTPTSA